MDFLDPRKQKAHTIRLIVGYVLIGLAILIATTILLYQAYGFGLGKDGEVVQNGLVFVSSQPSGSQVYVNNELYKDTTSARLQLPEGAYTIDIKRDGYNSWHRTVTVEGGSVTRYDYPLLIPTSLKTTTIKNYANTVPLITQSPDRRWLVVQQPANLAALDVYDLADPKAINQNVTQVVIPDTLSQLAANEGSWQAVEWSDDNRHVMLSHTVADTVEYVMLDRTDITKSVNVSKILRLTAGQVPSLHDKRFDRYYVYDPAAKTVSTATLDGNPAVSVLTDVLAFKSYGDDMLLYATTTDATPGSVVTMLRDGTVTYKIREHVASDTYLLDLAKYSGDWYVAVGSKADDRVYVFKNPQTARKANSTAKLVPVANLRVTAPNYLAFSSNTRFIMAESGTNFAVYDAEYDKKYTYASTLPIDGPQTHATWMDGHRLSYVSGGKQVLFDYDNINQQTLVAANASYPVVFDRNYDYVYNLTPPNPAANNQVQFTQTSLQTARDQ